MDIQFDFEQAGNAENCYEQVIISLKEYVGSIKNEYTSLHGASWEGNAEKSFVARFDEITGLWECLIGQLEATKQAIRTVKTDAEPIHEKIESLM